jgi:transcriptional regulator with XRE-family HTH domain
MPPVNASRLRDRRDELDLSNADLADRLDIAQGYAENILYGTDAPSMRVVYRLSRALALPVDEILAGDRTPQGDPSEPPQQPKPKPKEKRRKEPAGPGPAREDSARGAA